jgi:hypothetical protein
LQDIHAVAHLTEATIAVETEDAADFPGAMVMVDMLRLAGQADCTDTTLFSDQFVNPGRADAVSPLQVVMPGAAVQSGVCRLPLGVVTGLTVTATTAEGRSVSGEVIERFHLSAGRTPLHTVRNWNTVPYGFPLCRAASPVARGPTKGKAELTVSAATIG